MRTKVIIVLIFLVISTGCHPFNWNVQALLNETKVNYKLVGCYGGWIERKMYCDIKVSRSDVSVLAEKLDLVYETRFEDEDEAFRLLIHHSREFPLRHRNALRPVIQIRKHSARAFRTDFSSRVIRLGRISATFIKCARGRRRGTD